MSVSCNGKVPLEQAMEMSLDDYISVTGIIDPTLRPKQNKTIPALMETEIDINDLEDMPQVKSTQWRLLPPNISNRQAGMPPLVAVQAENLHNPLRGNFENTRKWGKWNNQNRNGQRHNNRNMQENGDLRNRLSNQNEVKDLQIEVDNVYSPPPQPFNKRNFNKFYVKPYSNNRNNHNSEQNLPRFSVQSRLNLNPNPIISNGPTVGNTSEILNDKLLMNVAQPLNLCQELAPYKSEFTALTQTLEKFELSKILEQWKDVQKNFQNKYDMKLQKEIAILVKKPLLYTCPGAVVVSSDGPGIECEVKNHATSTSFNQRFA